MGFAGHCRRCKSKAYCACFFRMKKHLPLLLLATASAPSLAQTQPVAVWTQFTKKEKEEYKYGYKDAAGHVRIPARFGQFTSALKFRHIMAVNEDATQNQYYLLKDGRPAVPGLAVFRAGGLCAEFLSPRAAPETARPSVRCKNVAIFSEILNTLIFTSQRFKVFLTDCGAHFQEKYPAFNVVITQVDAPGQKHSEHQQYFTFIPTADAAPLLRKSKAPRPHQKTCRIQEAARSSRKRAASFLNLPDPAPSRHGRRYSAPSPAIDGCTLAYLT